MNFTANRYVEITVHAQSKEEWWSNLLLNEFKCNINVMTSMFMQLNRRKKSI